MTKLASRLAAIAFAIAFSLATVLGALTIARSATLRYSELADEKWPLLFNVVWVAFPFLVFTIAGIERRTPWLFALVSTLGAWGTFAVSARNGSGDANIGIGLLMLVSPFAITALALLIDRIRARA
ncbi:hypothetical protein KYN89_05880 [Alteriqipengyuania sp. NZ-12B]|uniref:Uncharacterized protein n=1 Tax=Alteriqipengyuania abyssalis TaxID=2860200 RepID=A0ABS7PBZ1_9SPHN|nr:hypothetical protein [Alteriqipengyuania abyssalis]MBY8336570.1 hypothetical protein [Alteriqipengyuania abyssalis]